MNGHERNVFVNLINRLTNFHLNQLMNNPLVGYMEYDQLILLKREKQNGKEEITVKTKRVRCDPYMQVYVNI